jgi:hypothetical protein
VAGWGEDRALEAVTDFAKTIDELARGSRARGRKRSIARLSPCSWAPAGGLPCPQAPGQDAGSAAIAAIVYFEGKEPP